MGSLWFINSEFTSIGLKALRPIKFLLLLWKELEYILLYSLLKEEQINLGTAEDLVYVNNNLRLLSPNSAEYNEEEIKIWDIGVDGFDFRVLVF